MSRMMRGAGHLAAALLWLALGASGRAAEPTPPPASGDTPEAASPRTEKTLARANRHMIVAAHPLAAQAGRDMLRAGGNATDAAIAATFVLNVVEPQSSGIGGGGFMLVYERRTRALAAWDGRETAPATARPERFLNADGRPRRFGEAIGSGLSVGTPGLVAMLHAAHDAHGRLAWPMLLLPAIRLARDGFPISQRLAALIAGDPLLRRNPAARSFFFHPDGAPRRAGELLFNPELADVLRRIALVGPPAFYRGDIAADLVAAVRSTSVPGDLEEADLAGYTPKRRVALCTPYRQYAVCGMPPPSSGAVSVAQMLGLLEHLPQSRETLHSPLSLPAVHAFAEAGRLAYADRDHYLADPDFVPQPIAALLEPRYLAARSQLIRPDRSLGTTEPGRIDSSTAWGMDATDELAATTHLSVVDREGNAVALTASIESAFGSRIFVRGFLLNNQLTDFSFTPESGGAPIANRVEAGKRPRSSMAPTLVFALPPGRGRPLPLENPRAPGGALRWVTGSPGGPAIINYVARHLVALIDGRLDVQVAAALPHAGSRNRTTDLEVGTDVAALATALEGLGHRIRIEEQTSGVHSIGVAPARGPHAPHRLTGGADPRREGVALGD